MCSAWTANDCRPNADVKILCMINGLVTCHMDTCIICVYAYNFDDATSGLWISVKFNIFKSQNTLSSHTFGIRSTLTYNILFYLLYYNIYTYKKPTCNLQGYIISVEINFMGSEFFLSGINNFFYFVIDIV